MDAEILENDRLSCVVFKDEAHFHIYGGSIGFTVSSGAARPQGNILNMKNIVLKGQYVVR
jgi:hypothetical protein